MHGPLNVKIYYVWKSKYMKYYYLIIIYYPYNNIIIIFIT